MWTGRTVSSHNFNSQNFNLRFSNPRIGRTARPLGGGGLAGSAGRLGCGAALLRGVLAAGRLGCGAPRNGRADLARLRAGVQEVRRTRAEIRVPEGGGSSPNGMRQACLRACTREKRGCAVGRLGGPWLGWLAVASEILVRGAEEPQAAHLHVLLLSSGGVYLSDATSRLNAASFVLCAFRRVKDHHTLPNDSPRPKKTCIRQAVLDKWFPLTSGGIDPPSVATAQALDVSPAIWSCGRRRASPRVERQSYRTNQW